MWFEDKSVLLVTKYPKILLVTLLAVTLGFVFTFLPKMEEKGTTSLLGEDHIVNKRLRQLREDYTGKPQTAIYIRLVSDEQIIRKESLERLQKLTLAFENLSILQPSDIDELKAFANEQSSDVKQRLHRLIDAGLDETSWEELLAIADQLKEKDQWDEKAEALFTRVINRLKPIKEVRSLANVDNIRGDGDGGLDISPFYEKAPDTPEGLQALKAEVESNSLVAGSLYNEKYLGILLQSDIPESDNKSLILLYNKTKQLVTEEIPGAERYYMVGEPVVVSQMAAGSETMGKLMLLLIVFVFFILWFCLRSIVGMVLPLLDAMLTIMVTMALLPLFGVGMDSITSGIPIFLLSIGIADGIHMLSVYRENLLDGMNKKDAVEHMVRKMFIPVSLTTITTALGFAAFGNTEMIQIQHLGLFVAAGSVIALIYSFYFIPAMLMILPANKKIARKGLTIADRWLVSSLEAITHFCINRPKQVLLYTLAICAVCSFGFTRLNVESDLVRGFFKEDSPIVISSEEFNKTTGSSDLYVKVILEGDGSFKEIENLQALEKFQLWLDEYPIVGKTFSLVDLLKRFNYVIHDSDPAYNRLPNAVEKERIKEYIANEGEGAEALRDIDVSGQKLVAQYLFLYENQGGEDLTDIVDTNYKNTLISLMVRSTSSKESLKLLDDIEQYQRENLPANFKVEFIGSTYNTALTFMEIIKGQLTGLFSSTLLVMLVMAVIYRSVVKALIGMVPLFITILVHFGMMGLFRVDLDWGSSMVSALVIGVGVDYSIHYLSSLFKEIEANVSYKEAMMKNIKKVGKPIMANALAVGLSFLVFLFGDVVPLAKIGLTMSLTLGLSAVATLIIIPAILAYFKPAFLFKTPEKVDEAFDIGKQKPEF